MKRITWDEARIAGLRKYPHQHKYDHGHLLVLSGPRFQTGAARMAARAGLRVGAGLVTLGASREAMSELAPHLTEVMLTEISGSKDLAQILERDARLNALCAGPALGLGDNGAALINVAISIGRACVLDADALSMIAKYPYLREKLHPGCVLTPHGGEFSRLIPNTSLKQRTTAVCDLAEELGCVVLLKGSNTLVADPDGGLAGLESSGVQSAPWLATAGSGDVLAGLIAGLLARGMAPTDAAETGALLHVEAAKRCGPGLIAGDLPEMVPQVLRDLGV